MSSAVVHLVRIRRAPGSFGDLLVDRLAVLVPDARPDGLGRLPVRLVEPAPVYVRPEYLEADRTGEERNGPMDTGQRMGDEALNGSGADA